MLSRPPFLLAASMRDWQADSRLEAFARMWAIWVSESSRVRPSEASR